MSTKWIICDQDNSKNKLQNVNLNLNLNQECQIILNQGKLY